MPAAKLDIFIEQGTTWEHSLMLQDSNGASINLTGYTAQMQIRASFSAANPLITLTNTNGRITITQLTGSIDLLLQASETTDLNFSNAVYDLIITSPAGRVTRLLQGTAILNFDVTRS